MKKYFVLIGAAIMAMALVSPAMAQAPTDPFRVGYNVQAPIVTPFSEFKTWGHLEIQTIWESKPDFNVGRGWSKQPSQSYAFSGSSTGRTNQDILNRHIAERFRMHFQYGDPKTVRAVLGFEADSQDWGEAPGGGTAGNAAPSASLAPYSSRSNHFGVYLSDQVQLEVMWAFLEFMVPNTPIQVAAGMQRFMVGGRLFMQDDAPGVKVRSMFAPHSVEFFWWRQNDRARNVYQPNDYYGLQYSLDQKAFNIFAWGAYNNDLFNTAPPGNVLAPNFGTASNPATGIKSNNPWWLAVGGGFRPGNFDLSGQFVYNGGKMKTIGGSDYTYQAFALEAAAKYRIGPGMFAGLEYYYSTGNDAGQTDKIKLYTAPQSTESASIFGNDRTVFFWMNAAQIGYYHEVNTPFTGFTYYRANFEYSPTAWVRMNLNYLYIQDTSKGTPGAGRIVNSPVAARQDNDKRNVGQEINLITTLNIYKGFVYNIGLAVFLPGDIYDVPSSATQQSKSADTAYAINTKLVYAF